mmetsp:Transcript_73998/g.205664  ORF Transcript_73998/g.205664 Transcript_73998/m.205664 type:complete len:108 (-) Transcript_73998:165-488(-)
MVLQMSMLTVAQQQARPQATAQNGECRQRLMVTIAIFALLRAFLPAMLENALTRNTIDTIEDLVSCAYMTVFLIFLESRSRNKATLATRGEPVQRSSAGLNLLAIVM